MAYSLMKIYANIAKSKIDRIYANKAYIKKRCFGLQIFRKLKPEIVLHFPSHWFATTA